MLISILSLTLINLITLNIIIEANSFQFESESDVILNRNKSKIDILSNNISVNTRLPIGQSILTHLTKAKDKKDAKNGSGNATKPKVPECVTFDTGTDTVLSCEHVQNMDIVLDKMAGSITSLQMVGSSISPLNLSLLRPYSLRHISVTHTDPTKNLSLRGQLPEQIRSLNISHNKIWSLPESLFISGGHHKSEFKLEVIDLSYTNIQALPQSLFSLRGLKEVYLAETHINGEFVWEMLFYWTKYPFLILPDADDASCTFQNNGSAIQYNYSLLGCLHAKHDIEEICTTVNKSLCPSCTSSGIHKGFKPSDYPISHSGRQGTVSISLALDCSNQSLKEFPPVPLHTWELNISYNQIEDLSPLKKAVNLKYLDASYNSIKIETLEESRFIDNFMWLSLRNNDIKNIPSSILESIKDVQERNDRGTGTTFIGKNYFQCNCTTATETLTLINSMKIQDFKDIYCENLVAPNEQGYLPLQQLNVRDVCPILQELNLDHQLWIYILITLEVMLILLIVAKVWYDQRRFRRTGELPWCSKKMPRLPCDTILEGIKDKDRRTSGSGTGSLNRSKSDPNELRSDRSSAKRSRSNLSTLKRVPVVRFHLNFKTSRSNSDDSGRSGRSGSQSQSRRFGEETLIRIKVT